MTTNSDECLTIHCVRHWCTCGEVVDHDTNTCPECGITYEHKPVKRSKEILRYNDDRDLKAVRSTLGPVLDKMEF